MSVGRKLYHSGGRDAIQCICDDQFVLGPNSGSGQSLLDALLSDEGGVRGRGSVICSCRLIRCRRRWTSMVALGAVRRRRAVVVLRNSWSFVEEPCERWHLILQHDAQQNSRSCNNPLRRVNVVIGTALGEGEVVRCRWKDEERGKQDQIRQQAVTRYMRRGRDLSMGRSEEVTGGSIRRMRRGLSPQGNHRPAHAHRSVSRMKVECFVARVWLAMHLEDGLREGTWVDVEPLLGFRFEKWITPRTDHLLTRRGRCIRSDTRLVKVTYGGRKKRQWIRLFGEGRRVDDDDDDICRY